jgi:hypothetical protein
MAVPVRAAFGLVGAGVLFTAHLVSKANHFKNKSVLIVGPVETGVDSLTRILKRDDIPLRIPRFGKWMVTDTLLGELALVVTPPESHKLGGSIESIRLHAHQVDLICLVVPEEALESTERNTDAERLAKLVGELAGKSTKCALIISCERGKPQDDRHRSSRMQSAKRLRHLLDATIVHSCDLHDQQTWGITAGAILSVFQPAKDPNGETK